MPKLFGAPSRRARRDLAAKLQKRQKNQSKPRLIKRNSVLDGLMNEHIKIEKMLGKIEEESFWLDELRLHGKDREAQLLIESRKQLKAKLAKINSRIRRAAISARHAGQQ